MPKGSIRNPGKLSLPGRTKQRMANEASRKTKQKQAPGFRDDRYELSRTIISPKGRTGAFYDPELYLANTAAAKREKAIENAVKKSPRGGSGMENPVKALKRRSANKTTKKK
jgi:hypothetical protein